MIAYHSRQRFSTEKINITGRGGAVYAMLRGSHSSKYGESSSMRKLLTLTFALFVFLTSLVSGTPVSASLKLVQEQDNQSPRVLTTAPLRSRRRRVRRDRPRHRGIRGSFKEAGKSAGRGGKGLGRNMGDGRPVRGGKEFGKGMGGFGKHVGIGTGKIGKRVGKATRRALTP
jgi:hypothetical protein